MWWTNSLIEYGVCKIARSDDFCIQKKKKKELGMIKSCLEKNEPIARRQVVVMKLCVVKIDRGFRLVSGNIFDSS